VNINQNSIKSLVDKYDVNVFLKSKELSYKKMSFGMRDNSKDVFDIAQEIKLEAGTRCLTES